MNAPSVDIKDLLDGDSNLGLTFGQDLFVSEMPDSPDACVCIYDSGGGSPDADNAIEVPTVQVSVRGAKGGYLAAHALITEIREFLHGLASTEINGARYLLIWAVTDVAHVGTDQNNRSMLTINLQIRRTAA